MLGLLIYSIGITVLVAWATYRIYSSPFLSEKEKEDFAKKTLEYPYPPF
jgi:hypothetical protein